MLYIYRIHLGIHYENNQKEHEREMPSQKQKLEEKKIS